MTYSLYYSPDSANIVIRMALEELGVEYDSLEVPSSRSERSASFFSMNPRGLLPVLVDYQTEATVFETGAALLYLADKHRKLAPSPDEHAARAECLKWLFMFSNTLHADLARNFYPERHADGPEVARSVKFISEKRVASHFKLLDRHIADSNAEWFLPSGLSICDFYLGCCARWAQLYPEDDPALTSAEIKAYTALTALLRRTEGLESVKTALEKEGISGPAFVDPVKTTP